MTEKTKAKKLSTMHARFAGEVFKCGNATEAARKAGYKGDAKSLKATAYRLMQRPDVQAAIAEKQARRDERLNLAADYELRLVVDLVEKIKPSLEDDEGRLDKEAGNLLLSAVDRAARLRGKYIQRQEVTVSSDISSRLEELLNDTGSGE